MDSSLSADLANILNDPSFGDVVLLSKDGLRVPACRILLAARSPVFRGMFITTSMAESRVAEVPLPTVTTSALLSTLEFLYTDKLTKHPLTVETVIDVIHAARFFLVAKLQKLALDFFGQLTHDAFGQHAAKCLSQALDVLSPQSDGSIFRTLVNVLKERRPDRKCVRGFSREALRFYLEKTRNQAIKISNAEYDRLKCVILWCAPVVDEILSDYLTVETERLRSPGRLKLDLLVKLEGYKSTLATNFGRWLPFLDLYRVHPEILARVVEPLDIMPPSYLARVFRFQALHSKDMIFMRWEVGAHDPHYKILEEGSVIECTGALSWFEFARAELPITKTMGLYEWDFVVERVCPMLGLGFVAIKDFPSVQYDEGYKPDGWVLCCTGDLVRAARPFNKVKYGQSFGDESRVRVHLDMTKRTCSFTINGQPFGVAWEHIPTEVYPAVSLRSPGRVRLEPVGDVDKQELIEFMDSLQSVKTASFTRGF